MQISFMAATLNLLFPFDLGFERDRCLEQQIYFLGCVVMGNSAANPIDQERVVSRQGNPERLIGFGGGLTFSRLWTHAEKSATAKAKKTIIFNRLMIPFPERRRSYTPNQTLLWRSQILSLRRVETKHFLLAPLQPLGSTNSHPSCPDHDPIEGSPRPYSLKLHRA